MQRFRSKLAFAKSDLEAVVALRTVSFSNLDCRNYNASTGCCSRGRTPLADDLSGTMRSTPSGQYPLLYGIVAQSEGDRAEQLPQRRPVRLYPSAAASPRSSKGEAIYSPQPISAGLEQRKRACRSYVLPLICLKPRLHLQIVERSISTITRYPYC